jgi:hypothetical protein
MPFLLLQLISSLALAPPGVLTERLYVCVAFWVVWMSIEPDTNTTGRTARAPVLDDSVCKHEGLSS